MPNKRYNKQVPGFMKGGRVKKMKGGSANGKPVSKSKNPGLAKMAKTAKGKAAVYCIIIGIGKPIKKKKSLSAPFITCDLFASIFFLLFYTQ